MFNTLKQCCDDFILGSSLIVILSTQIEPVVFLECALKIYRGWKGNLNETKTTSSSNWNHGILMKRFATCYLVSLSSLWTHMGTAYTDQDQVYTWMHSWSQPEVSVEFWFAAHCNFCWLLDPDYPTSNGAEHMRSWGGAARWQAQQQRVINWDSLSIKQITSQT